ncbi:MAG: tetratricopeptide repeat protein, partial [Vicinamibacterales bacterium]
MASDLTGTRIAAEEAERQGKWPDASQLWDAFLESPKAGPWDRIRAIQAAIFAGRVDEAHERIQVLNPPAGSDAVMALLRAEIAERRGPPSAAVECWRYAVGLQADPYWARFGLARALHRIGHDDESRRIMAAALNSPTAEPRGAGFSAYLEMRGGRFADADAVFQRFNFTHDERAKSILTWFPGMTSFDERWALHQIGASLAGAGHAVDLGCWLGSLTVAVALGLEQRSPSGSNRHSRIKAYDNFIWASRYMDEAWNAKFTVPPPRDGEVFLSTFEQLIEPWKQRIDVHQADLRTASWGGEPIKLLSIDAMKSPDISRQIIRQFFPSLIAGTSVVFHQDFCHGYTWWIHLFHF